MDQAQDHWDSAVVRFAGDSGDGIQLMGSRFAETVALAHNDFATLPDFPAEIRAPAGTPGGVSAFQIRFSENPVHTPGDQPDVLVAMNPAALATNLSALRPGGTILINSATFSRKNLERAGYEADPRSDGRLEGYRVLEVDANAITLSALEELPIKRTAALRCRNFFVLGLVYWMFDGNLDTTRDWIRRALGPRDPLMADANLKALEAGFNYGDTIEARGLRHHVSEAPQVPGRYRTVSGTEAVALGLMAAAERSGLDLLLSGYPITPASEILHFLSRQKGLAVRTFQAEDEIAAVCAAIGAAYAGCLGVTTTSGPGMALKTEAMGLAVSLELPLVIVNVQRGGPSTGLPTKTEQSDLTQALFGRSGEAPLPVLAARSPGDSFWTALEAVRIAVRHMTPVIVLTDGYLANGAEPWRVPDLEEIEPIEVRFARDPEAFQPYGRNAELARPWAVPGTPGLEHRIGGLEKEHLTGHISYDPANHELMTRLRAEKIARVADHVPALEVHGDSDGELLVVAWGGTWGAVREAVSRLRARGRRVGHVHLRHLNPLPAGLAQVMGRYERTLVPELNDGQLALLLRARCLVDVRSHTKIQGQPFSVNELERALEAHLEEEA